MAASPNVWIVPATAVLLIGYAITAIIALASPSSDPQRGMATGFIILVLLVLGLFGGVLWFATHPYRPVLMWIIFLICAYPAVMLLARQIYLLFRGRS
jgi:hypothetical protein